MRSVLARRVVLSALLLTAPALAQPVTSAFTYQGELADNGQPASGVFDLEFRLFDAASGGAQLGPTLCSDDLAITGGRFTLQLDFGAQFNSQSRYVEVRVRQDTGLTCASATGYTTLSPRQQVTAAPVSSFSLVSASATTASTATNLNGQPASFYTNAANLSTGTVPDARLATTVARTNTASTFTAIPAFNGGTSGSTAPFSVDSTTLVPNLNADLLDGLSSTAFAAASHTHDASAISTGVLSDARISGSFPRLASSNTFTSLQTIAPATNNVLELTTPSISGSWLNLDNTSTSGRRWNLISTGSSSSEGVGKLIIRDDSSNLTRVTLDSNGNLGLGNTAPLSRLHITGQLHLQGSAQDISVQAGEGLQFGHYDGTTFTERLRIAADGKVGIGTPAPAAPLDVLTSTGQSLQIRQDGAVPGLNVNTTGGNAGVMRLRNAVEVWPSDDGARAGRVDIRNAAGSPTIALNGATGVITAANMPGIKFSSTVRDIRNNAAALLVDNGVTVNAESVTVTVPSSGYLLITATANYDYNHFDPDPDTRKVYLSLDDITGAHVRLAEVGGISTMEATNPGGFVGGYMNLSLQWVVPVTAGQRTYRTSVFNDSTDTIRLFTTTCSVAYFPQGL